MLTRGSTPEAKSRRTVCGDTFKICADSAAVSSRSSVASIVLDITPLLAADWRLFAAVLPTNVAGAGVKP